MALWGGRFTQAADQRFKQFNDSLRLITVWRSRILLLCGLVQSPGSRIGVLTAEEQAH